jgi:FAD dependent oxidoreductase
MVNGSRARPRLSIGEAKLGRSWPGVPKPAITACMNREAGHRVGTMTTAGQAAPSGDAPFYSDRPNRSPWIAQFEPDGAPRPLGGDTTADVVIVGAGIAGIATAFFLLRECPGRVLLVERDRVARGASGRNAGQLTTYFERPLCQLAERFGWELVAEAQRGFEDAHELLDLMVATSGATVRVERFSGHMGMFNLHHLEVHLSSLLIRERAGLANDPKQRKNTDLWKENCPAGPGERLKGFNPPLPYMLVQSLEK